MIRAGEIRVYVGGHYELEPEGMIYVPRWVDGKSLVFRGRYSSRSDRNRMLKRVLEKWDEAELVIAPDDADADYEDIIQFEKGFKHE